MEIKKVTDPAFRKYGKIVQGIDFSGLVEALNAKTPLPEEVVYDCLLYTSDAADD